MISESYRAQIESVADKKAIETLLANHSRGIDRREEALLRGVYHPDGEVAYGFYDGAAADFSRIVVSSLEGAPITLHRSHKPLIKLDGDRAKSETYVIAYSEWRDENAAMQMIIGGRYLDRLEKRDGKWGLKHRTYVLDWNMNQPSTVNWTDGMYGLMQKGAVREADPSHKLFAGWLEAASSDKTGGNTVITDADIEDLIAKQALQELGLAYCRGVDRGDATLLKSIFHPDATVEYGLFDGTGYDFADFIVPMMDGLRRASHTVSNQWFDVRGDRAVGETYVIALATSAVDGKDQDGLVGGRYLDRFERRDGVWKISHRLFSLDWNINQESTAQWDGPMYGSLKTRGGRGEQDPVHAFWKD